MKHGAKAGTKKPGPKMPTDKKNKKLINDLGPTKKHKKPGKGKKKGKK